jgi:crossover junction endodeoxyribonuclease RuvC
MITIGIDPGFSGAIAALDKTGDLFDVTDMPVIKGGGKTKDEIDELAIHEWISTHVSFFRHSHVFIEKVSARPGQGVTSMFRFGVAYGIARAIPAVLNLPVTLLTPQNWRAQVGLARQPATANDTNKALSRQRAAQLFHNHAQLFARVKDNGRADSALIALAGFRLLQK